MVAISKRFGVVDRLGNRKNQLIIGKYIMLKDNVKAKHHLPDPIESFEMKLLFDIALLPANTETRQLRCKSSTLFLGVPAAASVQVFFQFGKCLVRKR